MTNTEAIILLKECKEAHRSFKEGCEALDLAISALERDGWISVKEEPKKKVGDEGYTGYLVYANGHYEIADYVQEKLFGIYEFHVDGEYEPDVVAFMPLPEPPKEDKP